MTSIPAATVILLRARGRSGGADGDSTPEILMVRRGENLAFAGGALVFPGGRVDAADLATARDPRLAFGFEGLADDDAAARIACAREALEETGVLLTSGDAPDPAELAQARDALASGPDSEEARSFAALLDRFALRVDAARFVPFARWEPPAAAPIRRRFDTLFYLADAGNNAEAAISPDGGEAVAIRWTTAADVLAEESRGEAALVFPTKCNLQRIGQYATTAAVMAAAGSRPPPFIQPEIVDRDGAKWLVIPEGCDYPVTEEPLDGVRRE